ncbi:MAG: UMP kinase [Phycisphaerales bacterium]|nr:UMP kinase [Phycisphaerales bacterium]
MPSQMTDAPHYKRVLLKISGESFAARGAYGLDADELASIAKAIVEAMETGTEIGVVVGGGNMIRGADLSRRIGIDQSTADYMGMLGTIMNGMALKEAIEGLGVPARVMSAIDVPSIAEPFIRKRALRHFEKGRVVIFVAGTGSPFFTTDTCAALRAIELNVDILLKATKVDGVYTADPMTDETATRYDFLTHQEAIDRQLGVMDLTALSMCMEHELPVVVFDFRPDHNIRRVIAGESIGTLVTSSEHVPA